MTIGKPFKKDQSGNPGGRPKVIAEVKELAREYTGEAIETLVSIMTSPDREAMANRRSTSLARVGLLMSIRLPEPCNEHS